jgi:FKBP-type peptidyl-prolyl cis-trans isomerase 2
MVVQNGDMVSANYIGTSDGVLFDTSFESVAKEYDAENPDSDPIYNEARTYEPLTFEVGAGQMIPGFDNGVVGMEEGETKTLTLEPSDAYGEYNEELIQVVPLSNFTDNYIYIEVGETYIF